MTLHRLHLLAALLSSSLLFSCSDDESSIRQPAPQTIDAIYQIRIERGNEIHLLDFTYDDQQRISQRIETYTDGNDISTSIYRYSYPTGRIEIEQSNGTRYGLALNSEGYVTQVESSTGAIVTYTYNTNGYYYEEPSDEAWTNYEYLLSGSRCNLARLTQYGARSVTPLSETVITPGEELNDANLNLTYLITRDVQSTRLLESDAMLFGWAGRCDSNLPANYRYEESQTGAVVSYSFTYDLDTAGRVVRIDALQAGSEEHTIYTISYK